MATVTVQSSRSKEVVPSSRTELPELRTSDHALDKHRPLPTSLQSDFIPEDILMAIAHPPHSANQLGPPDRHRNLNTTAIPHRKVACNVWNFPGRREKYKHLTKNIPCVCGAGNDISFLYDVPKKNAKREKTDLFDTSIARVQDEGDQQRKPLALPDTLIPDEYHIVKNRGVLGLEYYEEKFATQPEDHEDHLVQFPSIHPTSRFEVKQLKKTLNEMLDKAGVYEEDVELQGPTQMHNLLELIKKEQNIYNIVFHELIRQSSVECLERGELLSDLRDKYSTLLNKVPRQIKGLHEEVLAQRALDRRLTEELLRFKTTICALTCELANIKEHDVQVTQQAKQAQNELKSALSESQKNAGLLNEYHDLYELQRKRLENHVEVLGEEREIWSTVAYSLALKVMEEHSLNTSKRLHVSEKSWCKLAHHFTILLSDNDTIVLTALQGFMDKWRNLVDEFNTNMCLREEEMRTEMKGICAGLSSWAREFERNHLSPEGHIYKPPDVNKVTKLYSDLKSWEQTMAQESEKFGGDTVLTGQEYMSSIRNQMYAWTDSAMKIFSRHTMEDGREHPDQADMLKMNEEVDLLLNQFNIRLTGENGVATGIIYINNCLEQWDNRFNALLHGSHPLPDGEWLRFYQLLDEWVTSLNDTIAMIGTTQKEEHKKDMLPHRNAPVPDVMRLTHKWISSTINGIDSEDAKLVEAVNNLHTEQVKWMVQMLLRLAPDQPSHSDEAKEAVLLGSTTIPLLQSNAKSLFARLSAFTKYVTKCCKTIVVEDMQRRADLRDEQADLEYKSLIRLGMECNEWVEVAKLMLSELTGETYSDTPVISVTDFLADSKPPGGDEGELLEDSKPSTANKPTPEVSFHDKEKLQTVVETDQQKAEDTESTKQDDSQETSSNQPADSETSSNQPAESETSSSQPAGSEKSSNQQAGSETSSNKQVETLANQEVDSNNDSANQQAEITSTDATETEVTEGQQDEPTEAMDEQVPAPEPEHEQIEVIGYDANTHKKVLNQNPEDAPPHGASTVPTIQGTTPDTKKAYEALAALESLQIQLISTEERAQGAESKAATMEAQLKLAQEKIRAMERQYGIKEEKAEETETQAIAPPVSTSPDKGQDKVEKPRAKSKEKSSAGSRSSSRSSNKSKKK